MALAEDVAKLIEQETTLIFSSFDEEAAFAIGSAIRDHGRANALTLVADVRFWDRPLFYAALPGTTCDNPEWVRRKSNMVKRLHRCSYRVVLERPFEERVFPPHRAIDPHDYAIAGGSFPINVRGIGIVGAITVSGLPEREDHGVAIAAIARYLGHDPAALALAPQ
ncbi:MAG TPA: heme-degrading domain-containing protein [Devosiaceae bacterium]|nr:heme-degrading domain-containing protein [Devosiaceae bacterium]